MDRLPTQIRPWPRVVVVTGVSRRASITPSLAAGPAERGIRLNTVNPGPVDTGYLRPEDWRASMLPGAHGAAR